MTTEMVERTSLRDQECQHGTAEGEVDQVAGQPVGGLLDRRTGLLGPLDRLDDLPEGGVPPDTLGADLDDAGLVDGPGVNGAPRRPSRPASTRR